MCKFYAKDVRPVKLNRPSLFLRPKYQVSQSSLQDQPFVNRRIYFHLWPLHFQAFVRREDVRFVQRRTQKAFNPTYVGIKWQPQSANFSVQHHMGELYDFCKDLEQENICLSGIFFIIQDRYYIPANDHKSLYDTSIDVFITGFFTENTARAFLSAYCQ